MAWRNEYAASLHKVLIDTPSGTVECVGGSYAGVPFFVEEAETSGGREVVSTPLPFSETHVNEDVGKKVRSFPIKFYLVGADCESKRESLEEAFNKEGAFELVHPHYGRFNARCSAYSLSFKKDEQEYIAGEATFVPEQDPKETANSVEDLRGIAIEKSDAVLDNSKSVFVEDFDILGKAKSVVDSVAAFTVSILDMIEDARSSIRSVSEFVNTVSQIRENVSIALGTPADFSNRIQQILTMSADVVAREDAANEYVRESLSLIKSIISKDRSTAYASADELSEKISRLVLMSSAAMVSKSVVDCHFDSAEESREMQDSISETFSAAAGVVDSIDDYVNLMDMQAVALKYLRNEMSNLAVVVEYPMNGTRDILSTCFDCYGSLDRVEDILNRNGICDPMTITPRNLRVLSK